MLKHVLRMGDLRCFTRVGRLFGMMTGYLDESYSSLTVLCGGWIADDTVWDRIIPAWKQRVDYESRISIKRGLKPLSRYHAADCSSLVNEFEGWSVDRQIGLVKKLQSIMTQGNIKTRSFRKPMIFAWGANVKESEVFLGKLSKKARRKFCYELCVYECLKEVGRVMREIYTNERITFIHDRGEFATYAQEAFDFLISNDPVCREHFVALAPMGWDKCIPLQSADMVAYDLMKQIDKRFLGVEAIRRSLHEIVGMNTPIVAGCIKPGGFKELREMWKRDHPEEVSWNA